MTIRVGIIGLGFGKKVHFPAFQKDPRFEVRALCSRNSEKAKKVAKELGVSKVYSDPYEMLEADDLDALAIVTPPPVQGELLPKAIQCDKHLFLEKPLSVPSSTAQAWNSKKVIALDYEFRLLPLWKELKDRIPKMGKIRHGTLNWNIETAPVATGEKTWKTDLTLGGGTLSIFMCHTLDYLEWLFGPIDSLCATVTPEPKTGKADMLVRVLLEFQSGIPFTLCVSSFSFLGQGHRLELYGSEATAVLENKTGDYMNGFTLHYGDRNTPNLQPVNVESSLEDWSEKFGDGRIWAVHQMVRLFGDSIEKGKPMVPGLREGIRSEILMEKIKESSFKQSWVKV